MKLHVELWALVLSPLLASGCLMQSPLVFASSTTFGFDASQRPDAVPQVTLGYDRVEVISINAPDKDATEQQDTYSVVGTFDLNTGTLGEPLELRQFFATGRAAQQASMKPAMQRSLGLRAGELSQ